MRIALVVPGGVDRSGQERVIPVLLWLIERLARRHTVQVVALEQEPEPCSYGLLGATVHNLGRVSAPRGLGFPVLLRRFLQVLAANGPFDVIHAFWGGTSGLLAALAGRRYGLPSIVSLAGGELVALPEIGYGAQLHWRSRAQVALSLRLATTVTVSSGYMRLLARRHGLSPEVVPLGVPEGSFAPNLATVGPPWRLLHVASLNRVKDQTTLLRALALVVEGEPAVHLDIIGEDTLGGEIHALSSRLGLERHVTFHGFLPSAAVLPFFQRAHLNLLPSRHDAAPVVVLEAAACALPTVGSAVGYVADWHPDRALAVPVGDAPALAAGTLALLGDTRRRRALGTNARAWTRHYNADWTAARFEQIYRTMDDGRWTIDRRP